MQENKIALVEATTDIGKTIAALSSVPSYTIPQNKILKIAVLVGTKI